MQEKTLTGGRSYYLDIARAIAIISISLNHAVNRTYDNYFGQMEEFLESSYLSSLLKSVVTVFSHLGVPLFLMISGALLLHKRMETADDVKRFYRHNLLELFITAEIWYFIMYWFVFFDGISSGYWEAGLADTLLGCVKTMLFLDQITMGSMWYMPMILCLYATIPFAAVLVKKFSLKILSLPLILVFLRMFVLPLVNSLLAGLNLDTMYSATVREANICSICVCRVCRQRGEAVRTSYPHGGGADGPCVRRVLRLSAVAVRRPRRSDGGLRAPRHPAVCHGAVGAAAPWSGASSGPSAGGDLSGQDILWRLLYPHPDHVAVGVEHEL